MPAQSAESAQALWLGQLGRDWGWHWRGRAYIGRRSRSNPPKKRFAAYGSRHTAPPLPWLRFREPWTVSHEPSPGGFFLVNGRRGYIRPYLRP